MKRKQLGDRHPDTLLSVNNLAVLLNDLGRATGNSKMLREAEPLKREVRGRSRTACASCLGKDALALGAGHAIGASHAGSCPCMCVLHNDTEHALGECHVTDTPRARMCVP